MAFLQIDQLIHKEIAPGFKAKLLHTDGITIAYIDIEKDSILPEHSHIHEQVTNILEGELELIVDGESTILKPGMIAMIPSNTKHSGRALTFCRVLDVFRPVREDYK